MRELAVTSAVGPDTEQCDCRRRLRQFDDFPESRAIYFWLSDAEYVHSLDLTPLSSTTAIVQAHFP
jgi:hypothetical protein